MSQVIDIKVPDIGDFSDIPVIEVFVKVGDTVKAEDPLLSLESDKATMDVPAPSGGVVKSIKVKVGDKVSEGSVIMQFEGAAATAAPAEAAKPSVSAPPAPRRRRRACRHHRRRSARAAGSPRCACPTSATSRTCRSSKSS